MSMHVWLQFLITHFDNVVEVYKCILLSVSINADLSDINLL